jgi:hypothetical protein
MSTEVAVFDGEHGPDAGQELQATVDVQMTDTGWCPLGDMSFEQWEAAGQQLQRMGRAWQWWIGDWVRYGEQRYGEKYAQAIELTGLEYGTLANIISVARRVDTSRRRENLSWSHHAEVASLEPPEQQAWLERAEHDGLTVAKLRSRLREGASPAQRTPQDPPGVPYRATITVLLDAIDDEHAHLKAADLAAALERKGAQVTSKQVVRT